MVVETPTSEDLKRWDSLRKKLEDLTSVLVAFSGGVDSSLLLYAAQQALDEDCYLGVTAVSASLATQQLDSLRSFVAEFGLRHREVRTKELEDPSYIRNHGDRCFHCKTHLFKELEAIAEQESFRHLAYGEIADDACDHRPGAEAARHFSVVAPLAEINLDKGCVRRLSRHFGLPTWDHVAQPCLASRVAYFEEVDETKLRAIEKGERMLHELGFERCRVRHHGDIARLELPPERWPDFFTHREDVVKALRKEGFHFVTLDLEGLKSGSLNRLLTLPLAQNS